MDKKLMIHPHNTTVTLIKFFGPNQKYLLSIDGGYKPSIYITEWETMTRLHQVYLPVQRKGEYVKSYQCAYSNKNEMLILVENYEDQSAFSLWEFKSNSLILMTKNNEENQDLCIGVHLLEDLQHFTFAVAEKRTIKYWKFEKQRIELLHKIHVKEDIINTDVSTLAQVILFTTKPGRLYIINKEVKDFDSTINDTKGQLVSTLKNPTLSYSCLSIHSDLLFLGSLEGQKFMEIKTNSSKAKLKFTSSVQ